MLMYVPVDVSDFEALIYFLRKMTDVWPHTFTEIFFRACSYQNTYADDIFPFILDLIIIK